MRTITIHEDGKESVIMRQVTPTFRELVNIGKYYLYRDNPNKPNKIAAIKRVKSVASDMGLREAKNFVEIFCYDAGSYYVELAKPQWAKRVKRESE